MTPPDQRSLLDDDATPAGRRALVLWLPEAAADLTRRLAGEGGFGGAPLVILADHKNARAIVGLSEEAAASGLSHGVSAADARAQQPKLVSRPLDPAAMTRLAEGLRRWLSRYSPWVGRQETSEDVAPTPRSDMFFALDVTGCSHLWGGEDALLHHLSSRLERLGFRARAAIAGSKGAAWALARYGSDDDGPLIAPPGGLRAALADLPPAALRLPPEVIDNLASLGVRRIEELDAIPRSALARRYGVQLCRRLDQAFGLEPEPIAPPPEPFRAAIRLGFPEPLGLLDDLRAGAARLLERLVERLDAHGLGARRLLLELRRVDRSDQQLEVGLAAPSCDAAQMLRLFERGLETVQAGFGVDAMRLVALETERRSPVQLSALNGDVTPRFGASTTPELSEVLSRIGGRLGFERLRAYAPSASHLPEKGFHLRLATDRADERMDWRAAARSRPPRPLIGFAPEPLTILEGGDDRRPPAAFRWRNMNHKLSAAFGPERIAPEWWLDEPAWRSGPRDYWRIETAAGWRLWLFRLAQSEEAQWFAVGRFG